MTKEVPDNFESVKTVNDNAATFNGPQLLLESNNIRPQTAENANQMPDGFPQIAFNDRDNSRPSPEREKRQGIDEAAKEAVASLGTSNKAGLFNRDIDADGLQTALQKAHALDSAKGLQSLVEAMNKQLKEQGSTKQVRVSPLEGDKKSARFTIVDQADPKDKAKGLTETSLNLDVVKRNYDAEQGAKLAQEKTPDKAGWESIFQEAYAKDGAKGVADLAKAINKELKENGSTKQIQLTEDPDNKEQTNLTIKDGKTHSFSELNLEVRDIASKIAESIAKDSYSHPEINAAYQKAYQERGQKGIDELTQSINDRLKREKSSDYVKTERHPLDKNVMEFQMRIKGRQNGRSIFVKPYGTE